MYKLIALDMDGTLLTTDKSISPRTKKAIADARAKGVTVVLASGRPLEGIVEKLDELEIRGKNEFVACFNGSIIRELDDNKVVHRGIIDGAATKRVAKLAEQLGLDCHAFSEELGLIAPRASRYTEHEAHINNMSYSIVDFDTLSDDHPIIKAMIIGEPDALTAGIAKIPQAFYDEFTILQSAPFFLEFLNPVSNKGAGIEAIAKQLGIEASEVICMGDAENDHHMLEYAGLGVAMANAMEETKKIADLITDSNDDDGVAKIIENYILNPA